MKMNLLSNILRNYVEINFIFYAYAVGYLYMAIVYIPSLAIPPLKLILSEFENSGTRRSTCIISVISGSILYILFLYLVGLDPVTRFGPFVLFLWFVGYLLWGYFALFLLADYKKKFRKKENFS